MRRLSWKIRFTARVKIQEIQSKNLQKIVDNREIYTFQIMVTYSGKDGTPDKVHHSGFTFGPSMEYTSAGVNRYVTGHHQCIFIFTITNTNTNIIRNTNTNTNSDGQNVLRAALPPASSTTLPTMVFLSTTLPLPGFNQVLHRFSPVSTLTELELVMFAE